MTSAALPLQYTELPPGTVFARVLGTEPAAAFSLRVRGAGGLHAAVEPLSETGAAWTVRVYDDLSGPDGDGAQSIVATATLTGTRFRAAQTAAGLVFGYARTQGITSVMPTTAQLRSWLDEER